MTAEYRNMLCIWKYPEGIDLYAEIQCPLFRRTLFLQTLFLSQLQLKLHLHVGMGDQACKLCIYLERLKN